MLSNRIPIILATAVAFGCAESTVAPTAQSDGPKLQASVSGGVIHHVSAGGPDACAAFGARPGCDANFSLTAVQRADGSVTGEWTDRFSQVNGGGGVTVVVNCVNVAGNEAWVSGVVKVPKNLVGLPLIARVRDNGTSANDPPDEISFTEFDSFGGCNAAPALFLLAAPQEQVTVQ